MQTSSRLVFFGTEDFSVPTLQALIDAGYSVVAIVTKPDARRGRGKKLFVHPIKELGIKHGIPILQPLKVGDIEDELRALAPTAAILVSYGKIIPKRILDVFEPIGIINVHPSALPRYRGPSPIEAAIIAGDETTAISIMKLDEGMDTGPLFTQRTINLTQSETKSQLSKQLSQAGAELVIETLPAILEGHLYAQQQAKDDVSVTSLIYKSDGIIDQKTDTAELIERKIRAYQGYPKSRLNLHNNDVIVTSSKPVDNPTDGALVIPCAMSSYLEIVELIAPSGRRMSGADYLRGYGPTS